MSNETESTTQVLLSDNAAKRIAELMAKEAPGSRLRIAVDGGGCSGFQYKFDFDTKKNADDITISKDGAEIVIDQMSVEFMQGAIIDYVETLGSAAFEIKNPKAAASCGCGNSFSV